VQRLAVPERPLALAPVAVGWWHLSHPLL